MSSGPGPRLQWAGRESTSPEPRPATLTRIEQQGPDPAAGNLLIAGDNLGVMAALRAEFEGKVDLIYLDPPFATGLDWTLKSPVGRHKGVTDGPSILQRAYSDCWPGGLDGYLDMLWPRLEAAYRLLAPTGSLFVHVGWQTNSHVRLMLDELFGPGHLTDEIVWHYRTSGGAPAATLIKNHATIYRYAKGATWTFEPPRESWPPSTLRKWQRDDQGRVYRLQNKMARRYYVDPRGKRADDVWEATLASRSHERTGYPTQKPEALLERIVEMACRPGDLVADFFCGSGTTAAVADRLGRRWIACDSGALAVQTARRRLARAGASFALAEAEGPARGWSVGLAGSLAEIEARLVRCADPGAWKLELEAFHVPDRHAWPDEVQAACTAWHDPLEEWEVDWSHDGEVFRPTFASRRVRQDRTLALSTPPTRIEPGRHVVLVRALDFRGIASFWRGELVVD